MAAAATGVLVGGAMEGCAPQAPPAYPPSDTGLWGQTDANYAVMHKLRDGTYWQSAPVLRDRNERYDLVVVGAGLSGLAAAYFYREKKPDARILILEIRPDFGGHAGRNEFEVDGRLLLSNAGTQSIFDPSKYRPSAARLIRELGIDTNRFYKYFDRHRYDGLTPGIFFGRETFGQDRLVTGAYSRPWADVFHGAPLSERAKRDLIRIHTERVDYLPHMNPQQKAAYLRTIAYDKFLIEHAGCDAGVLPYLHDRPFDLFGTGIEVVSAWDIYENGEDYGYQYPGFQGMDLGFGTGTWRYPDPDPYIFHFPDGNASIARMLVRSLVPGSIPGSTMEDIVLAKCDYARLDDPANQVSIRTNATAVKVTHLGSPSTARAVEVLYDSGGALNRVVAEHVVLANWHVVSKLIAPELPEAQKKNLAYCVKEPYVYTHVALRNWRAFHKLGISSIMAPGAYHYFTMLDYPVDMGGYASAKNPDEPIVLFMLRAPTKYGLPPKDQYRAGRWELFTTPFEQIERSIRTQLATMLAGGGFDPGNDIAAITVNRWSHGYAYEYDKSLWEHWPDGQRPCDLARKQFHRITIANSDSSGGAFTDTAIDEGYRAVNEAIALSS